MFSGSTKIRTIKPKDDWRQYFERTAVYYVETIWYLNIFYTNVSKWEIWDARRDWTFTNYHVWFGDTEANLTKYATHGFNPTTVWNNATPNSQTRTLSPVKETKYMAFSFDDISTNPNTGQGTAGPGVAEIEIWGYPSSTASYWYVLLNRKY